MHVSTRHAAVFGLIMGSAIAAGAVVPGSYDASFGSAGAGVVLVVREPQDEHWTHVLQDGFGSLVVAGGFDVEGPPGTYTRHVEVRRYLDDGSLDTSFGPEYSGIVDLGGNSVSSLPVRLAFDPTGRIVVGATVRGTTAGDRDINVIRLTVNGVIDSSFNSGSWVNVSYATGSDNTLAGLAVQSDQKILVAGSWVRTGNDYDFAVVRLDSNGAVDGAYGSFGVAYAAFDLISGGKDDAAAAELDSLGRLVVAGTIYAASTTEFGVARFTTTGLLDSSFSGDGRATFAHHTGSIYPTYPYNNCFDVAVDANNSLVLAGNSYALYEPDPTSDFAVLRVTESGGADGFFGGTGDGFSLVEFNATLPDASDSDDWGNGVAIEPDGHIVVVGYVQDATTFIENAAVARLTPFGALDTSFGPAQGGRLIDIIVPASQGYFTEVLIQADEKIVAVGGTMNGVNADDEMAMTRYHGDLVFGDDFESGSTGHWSSTSP